MILELLSRYIVAKNIMVLLYIMIFYFISQPEANYTIEVIIVVGTLIATQCMKYTAIQTFKQPFIIKSM